MVRKKSYVFLWILILAAFIFIHCFRIGSIPYGIDVDEMGMGYDAWCLSHFGTDRYLNSFPVYLINFSGGQSALYAYICAPFVYIWGMHAWVFRLPAIIFAFITLIFLVKTANLVWHNDTINLLVGAGYTIFPVFTMLSRIGLDCNLMLGMSAVFLYFFLKALEVGKCKHWFFCGVFGGIMLYSYVLSHVVLPLFLLLMLPIVIYIKHLKPVNVICMGIPLAVLAFPLILFHIINIFDLPEMQLGIFTIPKLYRYRSGDLAWNDIADNIALFFKYTLKYDNVEFNSIPRFGNLYFISIPFVIIGWCHSLYELIKSIRQRVWKPYALFSVWTISMMLMGILLGDGEPTVYRVNAVFGGYLFFVVDAIILCYRFIASHKQVLAQGLAILLGACYIFSFGAFVKYYFTEYTDDTYLLELFNFTFADVLEYIEESLPEDIANRTTYIGDCNQTYIFYLGSTAISPYEYNELVDDEPYTLWLWTEYYKNYRFNFPEEVDLAGNYIVPETSEEYIELYKSCGFEFQHIGNYYLFWNPY